MTPTPRRHLVVAMLAVALLATLVALPGAWIRSTHGNATSADEPHYLLTAASLGADGDLDVANQMEAERYRDFHEQQLRRQAAIEPDGREVVPHDPLLPAILALPIELGGWRAARATLAVVLGALAALTLWVAVRRFGARLGPATVVVGLLCATAPVVVYGSQVYPEVPAALALVAGVAASSGRGGWRSDLGTVVAVVTLPWLAVKYVPVAATLAIVHLVRQWRLGRRSAVGWQVAGLAAAGVAYLVAHLAWYGGATVYAAGAFFRDNGAQLSVVGTSPEYLGRARRLVGLLVDRDFGIATWQPAWLLGVGGLAWLVGRRPTGWGLVAWPVLVGWCTATFVALTMHGWWFPGRQVVVILPLVAIALAGWASQRSTVLLAVAVTGVAGAITTGWLLVDGLAGRLTLIVDFALADSPVLALLRPVLPNYFEVTAMTWVWQALWMVVVAVCGWAGLRDGTVAASPGQEADSDAVSVPDPEREPEPDPDPGPVSDPEPAPDPVSEPDPSISRTVEPSSPLSQASGPAASTDTTPSATRR